MKKHTKLLPACTAQLDFVSVSTVKSQRSHPFEPHVMWAGLFKGTGTSGAVLATPSDPMGLYELGD